MQLSAQSEWMLDQKHAEVMGPGQKFEVIQTTSGTSIFFSIGSDNRFYVCREVQSGSTGWTRVDLGSNLTGLQDESQITVKSFAVAQNPGSLYFDLALVVTVGSSDQLFLSFGNANTDDAWSGSNGQSGVEWVAVPFDAAGSTAGPPSIEIDAAYLINIPSEDTPAGLSTCMIDVVRGTPAANPLRLLDRYYIVPESKPAWNKHALSVDLVAGSISCRLGRRYKDNVGGIYTFGQINSLQELVYAPAYDYWNPLTAPTPIRLGLPENAKSIATALNSSGNSHLFVSAQQGIFYFPPDGQKDGSQGTCILTTSLVTQAMHLSAQSTDKITALYGLSSQGNLFYSTCPAGSEASSEAWSLPIPLISQIEEYSFYINKQASSNSVFAHLTGQKITQLIQDPITHDWASRSILLPATSVNDIVELSTFNTRLIVQDNSGGINGAADVLLTANSPVGVYINDVYQILNPNVPTRTTSDEAGVITVVQPTQDMVAVCYQAKIASQESVTLDIDPADKVKDRIASIQSGSDLKNAKVMRADGTVSSLIPSGVSQADCETAATTIQQLVKISSTLPPNGASGSKLTNSEQGQALPQKTQLLSPPALKKPETQVSLTEAASTSAEGVIVKAGDLFRSILHSAWNDVKDFTIHAVNGVYEVVVQIEDAVYRAALDCVSAVTHAFEWVFSKLMIGFKDLEAFLGFVFNWSDILRTHKVIKSIATNYASYSISRISDLQNFVTTNTESLESNLNSWAGIPDLQTSVALASAKALDNPNFNSPQNYYIQDKVKSNIGSAVSDSESPTAEDTTDWASVVDELKGLVPQEKETVINSLGQIRSQIIDNFGELTPLEIIKRLVAIIGDLELETARNVVVKTAGIIKNLTVAVVEKLNKPISIPVISQLYRTISGEELSILDLVVADNVPFPDDDATSAIMQASDFSSMQKVMLNDAGIYKILSIVSEFTAMAGLGLTAITNDVKVPWIEEGKPQEVSDIIKQVSIPIKILVLLPGLLHPRSDNDTWELQLNNVVTDIAFLKVCLDATSVGERETYGTLSPYIDYAISVIWVVPLIGQIITDHKNTSSYLSVTSKLAYNVATMTGPMVWNPDLDPESKVAVLAVCNGLIMTNAGISVATGCLLQDNN